MANTRVPFPIPPPDAVLRPSRASSDWHVLPAASDVHRPLGARRPRGKETRLKGRTMLRQVGSCCIRRPRAVSRLMAPLRLLNTPPPASPDERYLMLEEKKLAESQAQRKEAATQRELEEKKLAAQRQEAAAQREIEEKKLAAQQQDRELAQQREHEKRGERAEVKYFTFESFADDGSIEKDEIQLRRRDWDNFLRSYAPGGMRVAAESGKAKSIASFDDVVSGTLYRERSRSNLQEQIKNLTSEHRNRVSADENALAEQLSFLLEPCFDGLVKAPMARRLYNSTDTSKLRRFAELVRLCNSMSHEQRTELDALVRELERSQKQSGPVMEFDAVLLNSRVAVVCESKATLGLKEMGDFHTRVDALLKRAADDDAYMVYRGMSILPVVNGNLFREPESKLRNFADKNGILLLQRNGVEYGPRLQSKEERECSLYASLLRNPQVHTSRAQA